MTAAHGSSVAPTRPDRPTRRSAAGAAGEPWRPRNSARSAVDECGRAPTPRKASRPAKAPAPGRARQDGPGLRVALAHDLQRRVVPDRSQHPLGVVGRRQPSGLVARVPHGQARELDRVVRRDEQQQFLLQPVALADVPGVALAVADGDGRPGPAGQGRRGPELAGGFVAQVDRLAGRVGDRVVGPGRQPVHLAVAGPGVAGPGVGREAAEAGVGQDVDPRGRGQPRAAGGGAVDDDDVLAAVRREASEAVPEDEVLGRRVGPLAVRPVTWREVCRQVRAARRAVPARAGVARPADRDRPGGPPVPRPRSTPGLRRAPCPRARTNTPPGLPSNEPAGPLCRSLFSRSAASRGRPSRMTRSRSMPRRRT